MTYLSVTIPSSVLRAKATMLGGLLALSCSGTTQRPPAGTTQPLEVRAGIGTLGQAEAVCLVCGTWLRLKLRSDCTTRGKLWVTLRSGAGAQSNWAGTPQSYDAILPERSWQSVVVDLPETLPRDVRVLAVNVRAYCVGKDEVMLLKNGDAKCQL